MFSTIGRHRDLHATTRAALAVVLLFTAAWTATWAWIVTRVATWAFWMLVWLASVLWSWLVPTYQPLQLDHVFAELAIEEPEEPEPVEVEIDTMGDLSEEWESPGAAETLDAGDLAEAEALLEQQQAAERAAAHATLKEEIARNSGVLMLLGTADDTSEMEDVFADSEDVFRDLSGLEEGQVVGVMEAGDSGGLGARGAGGMGLRGSGAVGGGTGSGVGGLGTRGGAGFGRLGTDDPAEARPRAAVHFPEVLSGDLDPDEVQAVVRRRSSALRYCYERAVHGGFEGEGTVTFTVEIDPRGRVTGTRVHSSGLTEDAIEGCAGRVLRRLRFPSPGPGGVTVRQPLAFTIE